MPKRSRPTRYQTDLSVRPALWRKWRKWLPRMRSDITDMLGKRDVFWELQDVAKENPKILNPGNFFDWMCRNYVIAQTVGIRGLVDQHKHSHSLWRLLFEILEHPGVLDRNTHVRMYRSSPLGETLGHMSFNAAVGRGSKCLGLRVVRADLRRIEDASERVRRFVNKRVAHRTSPGEIRKLPTFDEIDTALETLDEIFCKYNLLLTAQGMTTCHATRQHEWREVLLEPWVVRGGKLYPTY